LAEEDHKRENEEQGDNEGNFREIMRARDLT